MFCHYCGKKIKASASFCPYCGKSISEDSDRSVKQHESKKRSWVIAFTIAIVILLISFKIILTLLSNNLENPAFFNKNNNDEVYIHQKKEEYTDAASNLEDGSFIDENNIGEIYFYQTEMEHIAVNEKGKMYADNEILLVANDGVTYDDMEKLASSYSAEIVGWIEQTGDYQWKLSRVYSEEELIDLIFSLEKDDRVLSAYVDSVFQMSGDDVEGRDGFLYGKKWEKSLQNFNDCKGSSWGFEAIETLAAWDILKANSKHVVPVKVGLIDGGFDTEHEDLGFAETFYTDIGDTEAGRAHGTHVAGTMAAKSNNQEGICGVYPYGDGNLYGVSYSGIQSYSENRVTSMYYKIACAELILRNVKVINISLGFNYHKWDPPLKYTDPEWADQVAFLEDNAYVLADFLNRLLEKGYDFVLVNSAGNSSNRRKNIVYDSKYNSWITVIDEEDYPDVYNRIIVVGAVNSKFEICNFSNGGDRVDIYAPGDTIFSTIPNNKYEKKNWSGTSMAAPHISGIAAMVWSLNNKLTGNQVKEFVCSYSNLKCTSCNMADAFLSVRTASYTIAENDEATVENGGILGWVVDAANEDIKIENATVTASNVETGESVSVTTDYLGHFELILPEGQYSLVVQADQSDGYEDYIWPDGNNNYTNPIVVKNRGVNYLDDWIKMKKKSSVEVYDIYLEAAEKIMEFGSWAEDLTMTADMEVTNGKETEKATLTLNSDMEITGYSAQNLSNLQMSGSASMSILDEEYAWTLLYENGVANYQYTKPKKTSKSVAMDPNFFDLRVLTKDMLLNAEFVDDQIRFTVSGDKMSEVGIAAIKEMNGVDDLQYGDVDVVVNLDSTGELKDMEMCFHASLIYRGYGAEVDYNIVYRFEKREVSLSPAAGSEPMREINRDDIPEDALEYNGHYYYLYENTDYSCNTWAEARDYCHQMGGYLAVINDQAENDMLYSYILSRNSKNAYFGYSDYETEGAWKWDYVESNYENWHSGEPNSENSNEDYAMFYWKYADGTWNDGDFGRNTNGDGKAFLCEWELPETKTNSQDTFFIDEGIITINGIELSDYKLGDSYPSSYRVKIDGNDVYLGAGECYGFAMYCQYKLYGTTEKQSDKKFAAVCENIPGSSLTEDILKEYFQKAGVGAHWRTQGGTWNEHSLIIAQITDETVTFIDANGIGGHGLVGCKEYTYKELLNSWGKRGIRWLKKYIG